MNDMVRGGNVFLAYGLKLDYKTVIEGLGRRFPKVWQDRERCEYYQHPLLRKPLIYDEYISNLTYCLFEKANQNKELSDALVQLLSKKEPKIYRLLKAKGKSTNITVIELLEMISFTFLQSEFSLDQCCKLATIEYLCEQMNLEIDTEAFLDEFEEWMTNCESIYLLDSQSLQSNHYMTVKTMLRKQNSDLTKKVKLMFKQYLTYRHVTPAEFLQLDYLIANDMTYFNGEQFLYTTLDTNKITQQVALEIICLLRCIQKRAEPDLNYLNESLTQEDFHYFDEHLSQTVIHYLLSETRKQDLDCFFKHYVQADEFTNRKLELDFEKLQDEHELLLLSVKTFEQTKEELTSRYEKNMAKRTKEMDAELLKVTRLNTQLLQEIEELKKENEVFKRQLIQQNNTEQELYLEIDLEPQTNHMEIDIEELNDPSIMIIGGAVATVQRLKQKLPNCKYFECDHKYNDDYFTGINQAILLTNIVNHSMTLRFDKLCPKVPKKSVKHTNVDLIIKEIASQKGNINEKYEAD